MTSKNLCFKLMKEDLKRRVWTVALLMLAFFFCIVIPVIFIGGQPVEDFTDYASWLSSVSSDILEIVGVENPFVVMVMVISSVVCGVSGFSYMHAAKRTDFFHSIPVKREQLFLSSYLNGILMMGVLYLLNLLIATVAAATFGVGITDTFRVAVTAFFFHMAFYSLMYSTVVVAMMMTGNIIIALLGTMVFNYYVPMAVMLFTGYMSTWLRTFSYTDSLNDMVEFLMVHTSPFVYYMMKLDAYGEESVAAVVLSVLLVTVLLAAAACLLYRLRPSEAAGKAMAFKKTMAPIRILLVIPVALGFSLFFYALRSSFGWAIFGVLCGALLVHCLMEIIYHFDFRKLFSHKLHLIVCMAAGILIVCGFRFDLFGYDSYLPKENQVKSSSVYIRSLDDWVTYGYIEAPEDEDGYYRWRYRDGELFVQDHMKLDNASDVIAMAEQGIQYAKTMKEDRWPEEYHDTEIMGFHVRYTLNSGRVVSREYAAPVSEIEGAMERIHDSRAYKEGVYPVLSQTADDTVRMNFQQYNNIVGTVDGEVSGELLEAYQEDLASLTYETRKQELPIGTIQFVTKLMDEALHGRENDSSNGYYYARDIADRCYYPVYPSFTKTLELLKENQIPVVNGLSSDNISKVEIYDYSYRGDSYKEGDEENLYIMDKQKIEAVTPALVYKDYYYMNATIWHSQMLNDYYRNITVTMKDDTTIECCLIEDKIPSFLKEKMGQHDAEEQVDDIAVAEPQEG